MKKFISIPCQVFQAYTPALDRLFLIPAFVFLSAFNKFSVARRIIEKFSAPLSLRTLHISPVKHISLFSIDQ